MISAHSRLDIIRDALSLAVLEVDHLNAQVLNEPIEKSYVSGYRGFFGPEVYGKCVFYKWLFRWRTQDGKGFGVMLEPKIIRDGNVPREDDNDLQRRLVAAICESLAD